MFGKYVVIVGEGEQKRKRRKFWWSEKKKNNGEGKERKYLEKENIFSAEEKKNKEGRKFLETEFFLRR